MKAKITKGGKTKKYNIIDNWDDVTLEKWQQLALGKKLSKAKSKEAKDTIALLSDIPKKLIDQMSLKDVATIFEKLSDLQVKGKLIKVFKIDGEEYGFLPDCDEISLGEWVDIEAYLKDGLEKNIHKIMAVLFRKVTSKEGKVYSIEAYSGGRERAEKFKNKMNAAQVQQSLVFFWNFGSELLIILKLYLAKLMKKIQEETNSLANGDGSEFSTV